MPPRPGSGIGSATISSDARLTCSPFQVCSIRDWLVGDLGCGTGQVTAALALFVARVIAVDRSNDMLAEARERVPDLANVDLRRGELVEASPIQDSALDAATLILGVAPSS